jgi:hypothetical protein
MVDLNRINKSPEYDYEQNGPVELVDMDEVNAIHPEGEEGSFIKFRRLKLSEMAEAAGRNLDDIALVKKIVKGWEGYTLDGKPVVYKPKLLEGFRFQIIDWLLKEAYAPTAMKASTDLPNVVFHLKQITSTQRQSMQQHSLKGFSNKKAGQRMQKMMLQKIIVGWEGVCNKGKEVAYSPELVELLPWSVISDILEASPDDAADPAADEEAEKN